MHQEIDARLDELARSVVDAAFQVHRTLGPGLLESAYGFCLSIELRKRGLPHRIQVPVSVVYDGTTIESAFRADLVVDDRLMVELKAVETLLPLHEAQLLTYLRLTGLRLGLLINFNTQRIKNGIKRLVN